MLKKYNEWKESLPGVLATILDWVEIFVIAAAIALFMNNVIIANSQVPTGSMETTIEIGDRVIGSRLAYTFGEPKRGDIAIFKFGWKCNVCRYAMGEAPAPEICPYCGQKITHPQTVYYVKRVIGLPGDVIEIKADGSCAQTDIVSEARESVMLSGAEASKPLVTAAVYVNGEKLAEDYLREPMLYTGDMKFEVPADSYFLMGDNRNNSLDARFWNNHYIVKEKMIAKVLFRYWPGIKAVK